MIDNTLFPPNGAYSNSDINLRILYDGEMEIGSFHQRIYKLRISIIILITYF